MASARAEVACACADLRAGVLKRLDLEGRTWDENEAEGQPRDSRSYGIFWWRRWRDTNVSLQKNCVGDGGMLTLATILKENKSIASLSFTYLGGLVEHLFYQRS